MHEKKKMNISNLNTNFPIILSTLLVTMLFIFSTTISKAGEVRSFNLEIKSGKVEKKLRTLKVHQGDKIELNWTVDKETELHLHGYDIKLIVSPGQLKKMIFDAQIAGRFPIGIHGSGSHGKVTYLEIYPR